MFAKRLLQKVIPTQHNAQHEYMNSKELNLQVSLHYGIPYTASSLAFDPIQRLLAIGTLDGRIKIIGGDNIEGLLFSPKKLPYKYLEFLPNKGFLIGVSNENDIQVWNLEYRTLAYSMKWEANITAFAVINGTYLMYVGDENGLLSVLKYEDEYVNLLRLPYHIPASAISEAAGVSFPGQQSIVGILPEPSTSGTRVLIAYENGLLILWDTSEGKVVNVKGHTDLQVKGEGGGEYVSSVGDQLQHNVSDHDQEEREICSLCWVSNTGLILAVGYINGDILLWNMSTTSSLKGHEDGKLTNNVVRLQLTSGNRRLPVIVLHWSANNTSNDDKGGQLFIYGGDEMGSEEVLTVLNLEWSSGIESLRCISRVELGLNGSFADMILIPCAENNTTAALFVLTNPGQLELYDGAILSKLKSEGKPCAPAEKFPLVVPTTDPCMTVTKLCLLHMDSNSTKALSKKYDAKRPDATSTLSMGTKWPLTGGVPADISEECDIIKLYIAGYQDGSVRIWDATYPVLTLVSELEGRVPGIEIGGETASVSALDFCSLSMTMAVGNAYGLVRIYKLQDRSDGLSFHFVSETKQEVHIVQQEKGFRCIAAFFVLSSSIRALQFTEPGDKLAVGFDNGQVAMLDLSSLSIIFHTESLPATNSPVISIARNVILESDVPINSPKNSTTKSPRNPEETAMLILTKDAHVVAIDSLNGKIISSQSIHPKKESTAVSMYVLDGSNAVTLAVSEKSSKLLADDISIKSELAQRNSPSGSNTQEIGQHNSSDVSHSSNKWQDPLLLLCCEDAVWLYSLKSIIKGNNNCIHKVNLVKRCCWATTFKRKEGKACGLILLYQTGVLEIRSLPNLEVLLESSLMSILRWSFRTDMEKTMCYYESGQIALVNGSEVAFVSLLAYESDFRIPESFPCLHDKVVAAAADAAFSLSINQKRRQNNAHGFIDGIIKGLKGAKAEKDGDCTDNVSISSYIQQVEGFFSRLPFEDSSRITVGEQEVDELNIDDIEIVEVPSEASTSVIVTKKSSKGVTERDKLFDGAANTTKPRARTTQEIMTQYRFGGDAAAAAADARDKLAQRQEKLQKISERTAELQNGAENFASMANELAKRMENRKWWQI